VNQVVVSIIKLATKELITRLIAQGATWLSWPIVGPIASFIIEKVLTEAYDGTALGLNLLWISVENSKELKSAIKTKENLKRLLDGEGLPDEVKKAEDEFDKATDDLVRHRTDRIPR